MLSAMMKYNGCGGVLTLSGKRAKGAGKGGREVGEKRCEWSTLELGGCTRGIIGGIGIGVFGSPSPCALLLFARTRGV